MTPTNLDELLAHDSPLKTGQSIVFFGDSITEAGGYIDILRDRIDSDRPDLDIRLINRGHSGYRVPMIQPLLQEEVLDEHPDVVVIYIGINDVWHQYKDLGTPRDVYENGLRDLIARCHHAKVRVVLASPSIIGELPRGSNPYDRDLDDYTAISKQVAADSGAIFCDLRSAFFDFLDANQVGRSESGLLTDDGVHMLPAGDALLIETMAESLLKALAPRNA